MIPCSDIELEEERELELELLIEEAQEAYDYFQQTGDPFYCDLWLAENNLRVEELHAVGATKH